MPEKQRNSEQDTPEKTINTLLTPLCLWEDIINHDPPPSEAQLRYGQKKIAEIKNELNLLMEQPGYTRFKRLVDSLLHQEDNGHQAIP